MVLYGTRVLEAKGRVASPWLLPIGNVLGTMMFAGVHELFKRP